MQIDTSEYQDPIPNKRTKVETNTCVNNAHEKHAFKRSAEFGDFVLHDNIFLSGRFAFIYHSKFVLTVISEKTETFLFKCAKVIIGITLNVADSNHLDLVILCMISLISIMKQFGGLRYKLFCYR